MSTYLLMLLFLSSCLYASQDLTHLRSSNSMKLIDTNCTRPGYKCSADCLNREICLVSNGKLVARVMEVCDKNKLCDANTATCTSALKKCPMPFYCTSEGVFPDPYDCTQYHLCLANSPGISVNCSYGYAFDASTGNCSLKTSDSPTECKYPQVPEPCYDGQSGLLQWSAKFYYKCKDGSVLIYKCDSGVFDSATQKCTDVASSTSASISTSSAASVCSSSSLYADPADCSSYYLCKKGSTPLHKHCPRDSSYNPVLRMCLDDSRICGSPSPSYANTCEQAGLYPDLIDCNFYYLCLQNETPKHEKCEQHCHFDAKLGLCIPGTICN